MSKADENYKRLRAELDELLSKDKRLTAIAEKITRGKATFKDSARYTQIVSKHMSDVIKRNIGSLKQPLAKEMVCKELLRDHYELINGVFGDIQVSVDEKLGIHLKPVKPAYPAERVDSWAHSLEDPTVEQSVIERRAASGSENIGNSMHDDCIKENAKWREQAGLDSYIVRDAGSGCCKWCAALEGRYRYADAPDDVFKRHDHCTCTVTYECGRKRQDVWSKRTWEASDEELNARKEASENSKPKVFRNGELKELSDSAKPKVFTPAEAKELERQALEKNPVTKLTPEQAAKLEKQLLENKSNVNNLSLEKQDESGIIETGGKYTVGSEQWLKNQELRTKQAGKAYSEILSADNIKAISESSGLSEEEVGRIKDHVFTKKHILYDGTSDKFVPDYDMAVAFKRLEKGKPEERDILLLKHELYESQCEEQYKLTASEAHQMANEKYNWQSVIEKLNDGEGEADDLL